MIKCVVFDLGLTLVYNNMPEKLRDALEELGVQKSPEDVRLAYHLANKYYMRERKGMLGHLDREGFEAYIGTIVSMLSETVNIKELIRVLKGMEKTEWRAYDYTIATLKKLKESGYTLGLISNWDESCRSVLENCGILSYLSTVIVSSEIGIEKPSEEIFRRFLETSGFYAHDCLYVGDNYYDDYVGSQSVGMRCAIVNPYERIGVEEITDGSLIRDISQLPQLLNE